MIKKGFAKRIVAMLMTLLMICSLIPANAYVTWAAEGTYTFTVSYTDTETNEVSYITDATITIYSSTGVAEENKITSVTGEAGVIGDNGVYEIAAEGLESGCVYTVEATGYKTVTGDLTEEAAVAVPLTKKTSIEFEFVNAQMELVVGKTATEVNAFTDSTITETYTVKYTSSDESIATVDEETGIVSAVAVGTVTITATIEGTDDILLSTATYELNVTEKTDSTIVFEDGTVDGSTVTAIYGETFTSIIAKIENIENATIAYSSSDESVATVNTTSGEVTIVKPGTTTITASFAGNEDYKEDSITYVLTVEKGKQTIAFDKTELTITNGQTDYTLPVISNAGVNGLTTDITYSLKEGSDEGVVEVDATGALTFTLGTGTVTIVATKAEDDTYASATAEYTLTVEEWDPLSTGNAEDYYTIAGTMNNGWYVYNDSDVLDIALSAKDGYAVSVELSTDASKWASTVDCPQFADGKENSFSFYIKDTTTGYVSKEYTVENIQVDTTAPEAGIHEVGTTTIWEAILIFFGFMEEEKPVFEIVSSDITSGVAERYYYIAEGLDVVAETTVLEGYGWIPYAEGDTIVIEKEGENVLYAKVVDNAGNVQYVSTKGLIFDGTEPTVDLTVLSTPVQVGEIKYYTDDVVIQVVAGDASPYSGIQSITYQVFCNGSETPTQVGALYEYTHENSNTKDKLVTSWDSTAENNQNITVIASDNNSKDVVVEVTVTDNAGNITTEELSLSICKETPSISVTYENDVDPNGVNNNIEYFQNFRTAKVVITSRDDIFVKENVAFVITAVDAEGNPVTGTHIIKWEEDAGDNMHVAYITFNGNAKYNFTVDYTDALGSKAAQHASGVFVIDDEAPTATISSGEPLWQIILETITLGIWSGNSVEITADWSDDISEIKSVEYYVHNIDFTVENPKVALSTEELDAATWTSYASFTTSEDATFVYYLKVTDWAGNYNYFSSNGIIIDNTDSVITITPEASQFGSGYYTSDVDVVINVKEPADGKTTFSGIKKVTYWIEYRDKKTNQMVTQVEETTLYEYKDGEALKSQLQETIIVEAVDSDEIVIHVTAIDNAGHSIEELNEEIKISLEVPTIEVTYEDGVESTGTGINGVKCYPTTRKAKIVITSNQNLFNKDNVIFTVNGAYSVEWTTGDDENQHIAYVTFTDNAIYSFTVAFSNILGVESASYTESFIIDNIAPTGTLTIGQNFWESVLESLTLGLWSSSDIEVRAEATDAHSTVKSIEYIMLTGEDALKKLTDADLEAAEWQEFKAITVSKDLTFAIYLKITDCAGNYAYINSNGYTVDKTGSNITLSPTTDPNANGYYSGDIKVDINVKEFWGDMESYSGIDTVKYWVTKDGVVSQSATTLMDYSVVNPATFEDLVTVFDEQITIVAAENNSDNVVLHVEVVDNAGNVKSAELPVKIDVTKPTITLSYDNNAETSLIGEVGIFNKDRVATIVITERTAGFDAARATESIKVVAKDKDGNILEDVTANISSWTTVETEGNPDAATHTATVTFTEDAYYELEVSYTDNADNANETVDAGTSKYPYLFTIDQTGAVVSLIPEVVKDIYTGDVTLVLKVNDAATTTGINSVKYWVTNNSELTDSNEAFYAYSSTIDQNFNGEIIVNAESNNSCTVLVKVEVIDNAGNVTVKELPLDIDIDAPTIEVSFDNNSLKNEVDGKGYYDSSRVATIVVKERQEHFNEQDMLTVLTNSITALDAENGSVTGSHTIETVSSENGIHTFKVTFTGDANYMFNPSYTDAAGLECSSEKVVYVEGTETPNSFAIDTTDPTASIKVGQWEPWEELLNAITFGLWSPSAVDIVITVDDATSPIASVQYYKTSTFTAMTETELDALSADKWVDYEPFSVGADDIFVVYVKVEDYTGHVEYIGTNGIIVDKTKLVFEQLAPEITITPQQPVNGIYSGDVKVDVSVVDPKDSATNAYAGLKEIKYEIQNMGEKTQEGTLYKFDKTDPGQSDLLANWSTSNSSSIGYGKEIVVDANLNNSNDVVVKVIATDNAGNQTESTVAIKIDTTRPTIDISYDNNDGDTTFADGIFFDANRIATITITERNFDASKVNIKITNSDDVVPTVSNWKTTTASGNGDNTTHTATITYSADGDYTFDITYSDNAGNASEAAHYGNALAPTEFTIDKTLPVISVEYDNNDVLNGNYYKADRLGTITITEHNFDASRVIVTLTATDDGQTIAAPVISNWRSSGDTHTATISYSSDALYTFDIAYTDKAGNAADDFAQQSFYVDKTAPVVSITGIVDQSANNANEIGFVITATDTNFDVFEPVLSAVVKTDNGFITQELEVGSISTISNGKRYTVNNIDTDGIYRIACTVVDKAGNAYTQVTLEDASGNAYVEALTSSDTLVNFSVNRDGSAFEVDENTSEIVKNFYVYEVTEDVVIVEVNTDALASYEVTLNGTTLVEGTDYTVATEGGNGAWMKYSYVLNSSLFMAEGEYTIVVSSTDKAENNAFSDVKDTKVSFVVDRTAPVVTITGMQNGGRYQADVAQTVTLIPTDDGGALSSVLVRIIDENGEVVKVLMDLSGDALTEALAVDGTITFEIEKDDTGSQIIEVICSDSAVSAEGNANVYSATFEVFVASSELALVLADTTLRYTIIGVSAAVLVLLIGAVVFFVRRKSEKDKTIVR